jgi:C4-dicarboxylate-specific signal transduction histidine kinase
MTIGALGGLSIVVAVMTHRHIVRPLKRLESIARTVRETRNYSLRSDQSSQDEIGRLAIAFNEMLSELAAARERELSEQSELARVTRLTTMGAATASIAHEINQPLAAIVTNGNVGLRWLMRAEPDLDEVRSALQRIVDDGLRAAEVIGSIRVMFRKDHREKTPVNFNDIIREVLALANGELESHQVTVRTDLREGHSEIMADRIQLQQVFLNLIRNAAEAMASVTDRARLLVVTSGSSEADDVRVTVEDAGPGIDPMDIDRIFHAFFTTKSHGMGMGLAICRSIIEAHDGRLWVSPGKPHGAVFHIQFPKALGAQ